MSVMDQLYFALKNKIRVRPCLYDLEYPRQPPSYPERANCSLKSLKDSTDRLYDPPRDVSGGEITWVGELPRFGR